MSQWSRNHLNKHSGQMITVKLVLTLHLFHLLTPTMRRKLTRTPRHIPMTTPETSNLAMVTVQCYELRQCNVSKCCFLHVKQLGKTVGIGDLPGVKEPDVHGYDEEATDVVPDGGHLEDSVGHQASDVDNTAQHSDHKNSPSTGWQYKRRGELQSNNVP